MKTPLLSLACAFLILASGCSRQPETAGPQITGMVEYATPVTFESTATLQLRLTDVSGNDGAVEMASLTVKDLKALPYQYSLPYDASKIEAKHRYTVEARISTNNTLRYATDTAYTVLTQGNGATRNITMIAIGENAQSSVVDSGHQADTSVFSGELRRAQEVTLYKAAMNDGHIAWLEEDRSNGTPQTMHARYEFKGALIMHYVDTSPMEVTFDERGRPTGIVRNNKALKLIEQTETVNEVRNRAELLRSHALATREAKAHRKATGG